MDASNLPLIAIEVVLIFGGVLLFGWWQLRDIKKERAKAAAAKEAARAAQQRQAQDE